MGLDESKSSVEVLDSVHEVIDENLSNLVEGVGEVGTSREVSKDLGSNKELKETPEEVKVQEKCDELSAVDQGTSYSSNNLVNQGVVETVVVIDAVNVQTEGMKLEAKADESGLSLVSMKAPKGVCETDKDSCVIDMKCSSHKGFYEVSQGEKICRICHLTFGQSSDAIIVENGSATSGDFIQLGCSCKDELGIAHIHCAEVWFKLKGNRLCEICGETAKNVSVVANNGFMEGWNDRRFMDNEGNSSQHRFGGCWRGQPFCNFLMACLVIAFILPWFFHVNMF
ncbi:uncharacterized protein LOC123895282 [Trifolium pratense]|uniref:uncharacterized protein LOC123895282 n=1 Tax=Trifolium pratense TaxID=57577 RepID=UPI001E691898|nr:uncharacterized protein LOC123895282 [Trifolium pratense]